MDEQIDELMKRPIAQEPKEESEKGGLKVEMDELNELFARKGDPDQTLNRI
jgi:hypothetical protein